MLTILLLLIPAGYFVCLYVRKPIQRKRSARQRLELLKAYHTFVFSERMIIDHSEIIGNMMIALNRRNRELLVIDRYKKEQAMHRIRLSLVSDCVIREQRSEKGGLGEIQVHLFVRNNARPVIIPFRPAGNTLAAEQAVLKTARRWKNLVDIYKQVEGADERIDGRIDGR